MLCTKYMASSEAMTSVTHSFAYSYQCFVKICENSKCQFLIFQLIFVKFSLFCFTLSSEIRLNLLRDFPFKSAPLYHYFVSRTCIVDYGPIPNLPAIITVVFTTMQAQFLRHIGYIHGRLTILIFYCSFNIKSCYIHSDSAFFEIIFGR